MSAENEDQFSLEQHVETTHEAPKMSPISYTRDFLLSLSELDICKKLPSGFDKSILSDFGDASSSVPEWPRVPGSLSSQSFRRGEYGSSPPTRGDSNYSRGVQGRWESRSSGSNDRDGDSQSDKDSDSGKRYGNQPRRPWQNPEHDGLLGSGAFPRPSGHATGATAPKVRGDGQYQLNRSNEPYHPPRPYKAVPHSRRDATDTFDDETFGSSEYSGQDREEEERKRRASFELFRKENLKSFQEKKQFPDKHIEHSDPDIAALLRDSEDKKFCNEDTGPDDLVPPATQNDPTKCSVPAQAPASRPRVPPGFRSSVPEKNLVTKSLAPYPASEIGNIELEGKINHAKSNLVGEGASDNQLVKDSTTCTDSNEQQYEIKAVHIPFKDVGEKVTRSSDLEVSDNLAGVFHPSCKASKLSEACEPRKDYGVADFDDERMSGHQVMVSSGQKRSASILDKLFGGSITVNSGGSSGFPENNDVKADDTASNIPYQSSKFTHWFGEEKKPAEDLSSGKPKDLLSLIVSGDKSKSQASEVSDEKNLEHIPPIFPFKSNEPVDRFIPSTATSGIVGIHEPLYHRNSQDATPGVLTCEDLEQSMLSEINDNSSYVKQEPELAWDVLDAKAVQPKAEVNNLASQHILSLLQKGPSMKDPAPSPDLGVQSSANLHVHEVGSINTVNNSSQVGAEGHNSDNNLTLETFFGTSFMKELQSVQAPVSVQRGSIGGTTRTEFSGPHGFPFPLADAGFRPSGVGYESSKTTLEDEILASNIMQQTKSNKTENHLLGFDARRNEVGSKHSGIGGFQNSTDGAVEIQLPEEESLITVGDSMKPQNSMFMHVGGAPKGEPISSSTASLDIVDKLAALNAALKDERSMVSVPDGPSFLRGPYNSLEPEIPYQNIRGQPSSPPFPHLQLMNHGRPLIQTLDSHLNRMNPQMKFVGPESMIHHEPPHHPFPGNVFRPPFDHSAGGPTRFDLPAHNHMLQHMHVPGQFLPPHLLQGHPRGAPLPPHPINHMAGYISEPDPMQGFPLSHRQPSYGGLGMPMPAPGIGGSNHHPEALGKLIEMELRANSKQMHPVGPGAYGHEVDMGFRYR